METFNVMPDNKNIKANRINCSLIKVNKKRKLIDTDRSCLVSMGGYVYMRDIKKETVKNDGFRYYSQI